jgi:secondary thiamine-phosphate synthase enzyme
MVYQSEFTIETRRHGQMHNIDAQVMEVVRASGISMGTVHIFNVGSTGAIGTIEYESGLESDFPEMLDRLIPPSRSYGHEQAWHDGNGHSHLQATLMGPSLTVPLRDGRLITGTWQQIFHIECDIKPRTRTIIVTVNGDRKTEE